MRLPRLPNIVTTTPVPHRLALNLIHPKVIPPQHTQLQPITHQIIAPARAQAPVHHTHRPVTHTLQTHPHVPRQQLVRPLRELEAAKGDGRGDEEDGSGGGLRCVSQRLHLREGWAGDFGGDEVEERGFLADCFAEGGFRCFRILTLFMLVPDARVS